MQTTLAGLKLRRRGANAMADAAKEVILNVTDEGGDPVRLMGKLSRQAGESKGLVILLHGWEGSENSTYVYCAGRHLYGLGYDIFRLNYRDHGDTHHLNEGLFYAPLFNEVFEAVAQVATMARAGTKAYVMGFSMGGNFVLRIARTLKARPIPNLAHLISISPVIDPFRASPMIDERPIIRRYFHKKWTASMRKKQTLYPHLYNFDDIVKLKNIMDISRVMIATYSDFPDEESFFRGYTVFKNDLADVQTPVTIITARDDPIIPPDDLHTLTLSPKIRIIEHAHGGHNGFFQSVHGPTWYDDNFEAIIGA